MHPSETRGAPNGPESPSETQIDKLVEIISRSQHNYRELIDSLDQAVFTLSIDGEVRVANRRLSEILSVSFPNLIGHSIAEFIESPTLEEARRSLSVLANGASWSGIVPVRLKTDGNIRYFSCWFQAVVEGGQIAAVTGWARDVTAQQEAEMRFTEFVHSLDTGVFFSTREGNLLDANPALIRMWGFDSLEDLQKYNIRDLYADPAQRDQLVRDTAANGAAQDRNITYRRKDGTLMQGRASALAILDHTGRLVRFQGTIVDVTERLEIERKLHREQEFNRRLIECFPDLIVVLDCEGRFTFVSERIKDILGVPPEHYLGKPIGQRVGTEDQVKLAEMCDDVISGRQAHAQLDVRARHVDGAPKVIRISASPLFDENGAITGIVSSGADVTESLLIEQQLAQKEKFAAMGEMMTGAAHELNNPLTAILGVSDLLREHAPDDAARRRADLILQQARRAASIVQNLLSFSRRSPQGRSKVNLEEIVQDALKSQQAVLSQKNVRVAFETPRDLPQIEGDRKLLVQIFSNIIANAEQSIAGCRESGNLAISFARESEAVRITFADDGAGIPPENLGRIFDPFFSTKRPGGGGGLGLTLCLAVVKEHGGTIQVESTPGAGATFHVLLPISQGAIPLVAPPAPAAQKSLPGGEALQGHTVLVVDDEEGIREVVQEGLSLRGMTVEAVESSEAALSYLGSNDCEIIVCDFNLPGMSGDQFSKQVRAQHRDSPPRFVFMTGELLEAEAFDRFRAEGARLLQKPFHVSALADLLAELLQPQPSSVR
jgi:two-component system, cell cycle sensor histidine kinase and response regulator CckA